MNNDFIPIGEGDSLTCIESVVIATILFWIVVAIIGLLFYTF